MMLNQTTTTHGVLVLATGAEHFTANIRDMIGYSPLPFFKLCWKYLTPAVCTVSDPLPADLLSHCLVSTCCEIMYTQTCVWDVKLIPPSACQINLSTIMYLVSGAINNCDSFYNSKTKIRKLTQNTCHM